MKAAAAAEEPSTNRELYALLHIDPEASDEEIRKAYRQWAQIYHPDKYQTPQMKDIATENFQRIRDAYEILTDKTKRQIYDIYGMEGLTSGFELGPKLSRPEEIREELEKLRRQKEEQKFAAHVRPTSSLLANFSVPQYLLGGGIMRGMAMGSEVHSQVSKCNKVSIGGNLAVTGDSGSGTASMSMQRYLSSVSTIEFMATAGLRSIIGIQASRHLSVHSTGISGVIVNLKDGSVNLSNTWTRQLSETAVGNIHLVLGSESTIAVGWQKKDERNSASGELKFGTSAFGASAHYVRRFSPRSHGRVAGRIGSTDLEFEIGGGRKISEFSSVRMLYTLGIQGISWRFELHRGGQKLIVPVLLATGFDPFIAVGAFMIPSSLYFLLKKFVFKPYYVRREKEKERAKWTESSAKVQEARIAAEKAQQLLQNVSNRKRNRQMELNGLIVTRAVYGSCKVLKGGSELGEPNGEVTSQVTDVTIPLNFLVDDLGKLKLHEGIKKSGIMGFYDPCPGDPKLLLVDYTYNGLSYEVAVDDYEQLLIPLDIDRI